MTVSELPHRNTHELEDATDIAGMIVFRPASGSVVGVPTAGGSTKGMVTRFNIETDASIVKTHTTMPRVIPMKGRPPSWKGMWFLENHSKRNITNDGLGTHLIYEHNRKYLKKEAATRLSIRNDRDREQSTY